MRWDFAGAIVCLCVLGVACGGDDSSSGGSGGHAATGGTAGTGGSGGSGGTAATGGTGAAGGTAASGGTAATGGGGTTSCSVPGDCPAPSSECVAPSCDNGVCGTTPVASGTPLASQTPGDCKLVACDGAGASQTVNDDTDVLDDKNPCTTDACSAGTPTNTPVAAGTACNGTSFCNATGSCVGCLASSDCGTATDCKTPTCTNGTCGTSFVADGTPVSVQVAGDCKQDVCDGAGAVKSANLDSDVPDDNNPCTTDACSAGTPTHVPTPGASCGGTNVCNSSGQCVGCTAPSDCPGTDDFCKTRTCTNNVCGFSFTASATPLPSAQQTSGDCATKVCDGIGNVQSTATPTDLPVDGNDCTDDVCTGSTPSNPPKAVGAACASGVCNGTGSCVGCNTAADCGTPSGYPCVTATCVSSTCGTANAPNGTQCAAASCSNGTAQPADKCNGSGACVDSGSVPCAPYVCGPSACTTSCASDSSCAAGYSCDTGLAVCSTGPKCTDYCNTLMTNCTGANAMYFSMAACLASCSHLPKGAATDAAGDSVGCRATHAGFAAGDPVTHCPHAGPGGAGVCGTDCDGFCNIALGACTGANQVYASVSQCLTECAGFPTSPPYNASITSGNSFACRMYHLTAATLDPATHCSHIVANSPVCF